MVLNEKSAMRPKNGHTMIVVIIARISGCANQKEISLVDQIDHGKAINARLHDYPTQFREIATIGKGERLDRPEMDAIAKMMSDPEVDYVIFEDLGRLCRSYDAMRLLGIAFDAGVRCISPNDGIDTADPAWEDRALAACRDHVGHNSHTSLRLKQKLLNRFQKDGFTPARCIAGYIVPTGVKSYYGWLRDDALHDIIVEGARRLSGSLNCCEVADYFNLVGFPVGRYARRKTWNGELVRNFYRNRLLGGVALRCRHHTVKQHQTGRRISVINPDGPTCIKVPHLTHLPIEELDELNARLDEANRGRGHPKKNGDDRRSFRTWKRTPFPGNALRCWYCGHNFVWGGNGTRDHLMCSGVRMHCCWFGVQIDGPRLAKCVADHIWMFLDELVDVDPHLLKLVDDAQRGDDLERQRQQLDLDEAACRRKQDRVKKHILEDDDDHLVKEIREDLKRDETDLARRRAQLDRAFKNRGNPLRSTAELRAHFQQAIGELAIESPEMGVLMRRLVPECHVYGVRCITGGGIEPRVRFTIALEGLLPDGAVVPGMAELITKTVTVDLFELPQPIKYLPALAKDYQVNGRNFAKELSSAGEYVTSTAIHRAMQLKKELFRRGIDDPYEIVMEPPLSGGKLRRHHHPRYKFGMQPGYERPPL